jgi:hypothetical protein
MCAGKLDLDLVLLLTCTIESQVAQPELRQLYGFSNVCNNVKYVKSRVARSNTCSRACRCMSWRPATRS